MRRPALDESCDVALPFPQAGEENRPAFVERSLGFQVIIIRPVVPGRERSRMWSQNRAQPGEHSVEIGGFLGSLLRWSLRGRHSLLLVFPPVYRIPQRAQAAGAVNRSALIVGRSPRTAADALVGRSCCPKP